MVSIDRRLNCRSIFTGIVHGSFFILKEDFSALDISHNPQFLLDMHIRWGLYLTIHRREVYYNNLDDRNDGLYCNGSDTCSGGICTHAGDPCQPDTLCNEDTDTCEVSAIPTVMMGIGVMILRKRMMA